MTGNKIADKIVLVGKRKSKEKENERQEIYIPPKNYKITNLLDATLDNVPRFITKKLLEVHDQSGSAKDR